MYTVTAKTGSGKTGLLVSSALAASTGNGEMILGRRGYYKGRVAYIAAENPDHLRMRTTRSRQACLISILRDKAGKTISKSHR